MAYVATVKKNYKFYMFKFFVRWFVPFPLQVKLAKRMGMTTAVWYQDTEITIESRRWYPNVKK